jgi:hypothetical protein
MRFLLAIGFLGLSACTTFMSRSMHSGYSYEDDDGQAPQQLDLYQQKQANVEDEAKEELGLGSRPLSDDERGAIENRIRLKRMETRLATKREKKQYFNVRAALRSDRERIYFLSLPTYEAKERWAQQRGLGAQDETYPEEVAKTIESNDIALGMSQKAVTQSWGDPDAVEVAGNPLYGYERWKYNRYISGNEGYQKEMRVVYFEGGRVVGWERP